MPVAAPPPNPFVQYQIAIEDNFGKDTALNSALWPVRWGPADGFSFANNMLTLTSRASEGWAPIGFMQDDTHGAGSAQGYGLYSATASADANQGVGICIVMWPADNVWPGPEIDFLEDWSDPTRQTGYATIHWKGSGNSNGQDIHQFSLDLTQIHTYSVDWERGSLTYYIDGNQMFQVTGSEVPRDAADGGVNESFGAEVTAAGTGAVSDSVSLHLFEMTIAPSGSGGGTNANTASVPPLAPAPQPATPPATGTSPTGTSAADSTPQTDPTQIPVPVSPANAFSPNEADPLHGQSGGSEATPLSGGNGFSAAPNEQAAANTKALAAPGGNGDEASSPEAQDPPETGAPARRFLDDHPKIRAAVTRFFTNHPALWKDVSR